VAHKQQRSYHTPSVLEVVSVVQEYPTAMHLHAHHVTKYRSFSCHVPLPQCWRVNETVAKAVSGRVIQRDFGSRYLQPHSGKLTPVTASADHKHMPSTHKLIQLVFRWPICFHNQDRLSWAWKVSPRKTVDTVAVRFFADHMSP